MDEHGSGGGSGRELSLGCGPAGTMGSLVCEVEVKGSRRALG